MSVMSVERNILASQNLMLAAESTPEKGLSSVAFVKNIFFLDLPSTTGYNEGKSLTSVTFVKKDSHRSMS